MPDLLRDGPTAVDRLLRLTAARRAGRGTAVVCVDGPSGSGKTTLAAALVAARPGAGVVHLDDLLAGWRGGLPRMVADLVADVLAPRAGGRPAAHRHYDWVAGRFSGRVPVEAAELLVVEGVGAGSRLTAPYRDALAWVEAPLPLRLARGLARDGEAFAPHWHEWAAREAAHFALEGTRERADLCLLTGPEDGG
ncbi:4-amino-4-deoxy-L-arabinose transferase [Nocardioides solisilvae]|uniref:4-amino-4-deoxy-L-arabinose transferase n=1 Tax=Nocardioides solisilvae TaxID=1542435 RepID=UPI001EF609D9|nr:4-amino-4-deoxy-L-arabinose transferase [Nocardioides solisilvae]